MIKEIDHSQRHIINTPLKLNSERTINTVNRNYASVSYFNTKKNLRIYTQKTNISNSGDPMKKRKSSVIFRNNKYSKGNKTRNKFLATINIENNTSSSVKNIKEIKISKKGNIFFPKSFIDKYENVAKTETNTTNLLPSLNNLKTISNNQISGVNEKYLTFNEIIPNKTIRQMKRKILNLKEEKIKNTKITNNDFRTEYSSESDIQKFNKILSYPKININDTNLIKYLNEKTKEPSQIKMMFESNDVKLNKMNKACLMSYINDEKEKLFNILIKNKVRIKANDTEKIFQKNINQIENDINEGNKKLEKYNNNINKREKYYEKFNDFVYSFWMKKNFDRFNKKSTPKSKYLNDLYYLYEK